jgi:hypothetical protein
LVNGSVGDEIECAAADVYEGLQVEEVGMKHVSRGEVVDVVGESAVRCGVGGGVLVLVALGRLEDAEGLSRNKAEPCSVCVLTLFEATTGTVQRLLAHLYRSLKRCWWGTVGC